MVMKTMIMIIMTVIYHYGDDDNDGGPSFDAFGSSGLSVSCLAWPLLLV